MKNINGIKKIVGAALAFGALGFTTQASAATSPYAGDLIINEYNAVGPTKVLDDCVSGLSCTPFSGQVDYAAWDLRLKDNSASIGLT